MRAVKYRTLLEINRRINLPDPDHPNRVAQHDKRIEAAWQLRKFYLTKVGDCDEYMTKERAAIKAVKEWQ